MPARGRHVAMLRGINVGGHNKLPMQQLRELFDRAGAEDVSTYIQSGNVVYRAGDAREAATIAAAVHEALVEELGLSSPIIVRSAARITKIAAGEHPLAEQGDPPKWLMVGFLLDRPRPSAVRELDPDRSPPDSFVVRGSEIYLRYPEGGARSKLTNAYFDRVLRTVSTVRNWKTVMKLAELVRA